MACQTHIVIDEGLGTPPRISPICGLCMPGSSPIPIATSVTKFEQLLEIEQLEPTERTSVLTDSGALERLRTLGYVE